jgi:hypothetical protein
VSDTVVRVTLAAGSPRHGVQVERALPYGHGKVLDIYRPIRAEATAWPQALVLLWHGVSPDELGVLEPLAHATALLGLTVVVPDWRSDAPDDGRAHLLSSLSFTLQHAPALGGSSDAIVLAGWSRGGRAAAGIAVSPSGASGWRPAAVVCLAAGFSGPASTTGVSPVTALAQGDATPVPFWLVHGIDDGRQALPLPDIRDPWARTYVLLTRPPASGEEDPPARESAFSRLTRWLIWPASDACAMRMSFLVTTLNPMAETTNPARLIQSPALIVAGSSALIIERGRATLTLFACHPMFCVRCDPMICAGRDLRARAAPLPSAISQPPISQAGSAARNQAHGAFCTTADSSVGGVTPQRYLRRSPMSATTAGSHAPPDWVSPAYSCRPQADTIRGKLAIDVGVVRKTMASSRTGRSTSPAAII